MHQITKIAIAEDHAMVRQGFVRAFSDYPHLKVVLEAKDGLELLHQLIVNPVDVIILDIVMPGMDGMAVIDKIKSVNKHIKILVVSAQDDHNLIAKYVKLGAHGFLPKTGEVLELLRAVSDIIGKGSYFAPDILKMLIEKGINHLGGGKQLTDLELNVLRMLCKDLTYLEIAAKLNLQKNDIGYYRTRVLHKTGTSDNEELQIYAKSNVLM